MDISNIKEAFKIIIELIKKGATLEAQEKIIELEETVVSLQGENLNLRKENLSLKERMELSEKGERCPKCKKGYLNLVESNPHPTFGEVGVLERKYECSECGFNENRIFDPDKESK